MSNPVSIEVEQLSIFQYTRGQEYAGNRFEISPRPERFKCYNGPCIRLKTSVRKGGDVTSSEAFNGIDWLKQLLLPSFGVTSVKFHGHESELLWSYPSAGGCYPVELYVHVRRLGKVKPGLYHYNALYASLYRISDAQSVSEYGCGLPSAGTNADVTFILTIVPWRTCWKYSYKGYRFGMVDAGHAAANLQLMLRSLGWQATTYTRLRSDELSAMLKLDHFEVPVAMIAASAKHSLPGLNEDSVEQESYIQEIASIEPQHDDDILLFDWDPIFKFRQLVDRTVREPSDNCVTRITLPEDDKWSNYDQLLPLIVDRRSSAAFERRNLPYEQLVTMAAFIERTGLLPTFHMVIHGIEELQAGVYRWSEEGLECVTEGDYRDVTAGICLGQSFIRDCSVLFVFTFDMAHIPIDEFSRYQQFSVDGGTLGQLIHLKSEEMGLGFSIIGGFYDDEMRALLNLTPTHQIIYAGAWGKNAWDEKEVRKDDRYIMNKPQY
ncbi:hypothetical protein PCURB6_32660 [Paenibacillus curdlanolyticus]|nr:hypothetical protein PCURB6_32660 [Paenibacillus curdlanolyticus]